MMVRSNSWLVALADAVCRFLDLPSPREPVLPTHTPSRSPVRPVGFSPHQNLHDDSWVRQIEAGTGGRSVFVHMDERLRHRSIIQNV